MPSQYATFSLSSRRNQEQEDEFNRFIRSHRVIQVHHQFVQDQNDPRWTFLVEYLEEQGFGKQAGKNTEVDYREVLSDADFGLYRCLRDLRKVVAERTGLPPYTIFTNRQLADLAKGKPSSKTEFQKIEGIGDGKTERYADEFLSSIQHYQKCADPAN